MPLITMVSKATEVCQVGTDVGNHPARGDYWRGTPETPMLIIAGIGMPLRLAGS